MAGRSVATMAGQLAAQTVARWAGLKAGKWVEPRAAWMAATMVARWELQMADQLERKSAE